MSDELSSLSSSSFSIFKNFARRTSSFSNSPLNTGTYSDIARNFGSDRSRTFFKTNSLLRWRRRINGVLQVFLKSLILRLSMGGLFVQLIFVNHHDRGASIDKIDFLYLFLAMAIRN